MGRYSPLAFAVATLSIPLLTLGFGLAGIRGSSAVTGGWLLLVTCVLGGITARLFKPTLMDWVFFAFILCCAASTIVSFDASRSKSLALFVLCCPLPYIAGRMMRRGNLAVLPQTALAASATFTAVAMLAIVIALINSGISGNNRTAVLGFYHAQTVFASAAGCMLVAFIYSGISTRSPLKLVLIVATYIVMTVLFLSLVRFTMLAIIASAVFSFVLMCLQRNLTDARLALILVVTCLLASGSAVLVRPLGVISVASEAIADTAAGFASTPSEIATATATAKVDLATLPSCITEEVRLDRSVEIRAYLIKDAFYLFPHAGLFGFGLDSFPALTCVRGFQVHNIYLQTFIELGWLAGAFFVTLVLWPLELIWKVDADRKLRLTRGFLVTNVIFFGLIGLAHGSITGAFPLFLFLGAVSAFGDA